MVCQHNIIQPILGNECIGDSLPKINTNFSVLGDNVCKLLSGEETFFNFKVANSPTVSLNWNSATRTLSAGSVVSGGTVTFVNARSPISVVDNTSVPIISISAATVTSDGIMLGSDKAALTILQSNSAINVASSPSISLNWNSNARTLSATLNSGFVYSPLSDPTDPLDDDTNASGLRILTFTDVGTTTTTPYTSPTQDLNFSSSIPDDAYMVLVRIATTNDTFNDGSVNLYARKNSTATWSVALEVKSTGTPYQAVSQTVIPLIFDKPTKTLQMYLYDNKLNGAPTNNPNYKFTVDVLGYFTR